MSELYDAALAKVKEYRGQDAKLGGGPMGELAPEVEKLKDELLWGQIWSEPSIDIRTRSLCTISALMVMGLEEQLANHCRWAQHLGVSDEALISLATQMMVYSGLPRGHNAIRVVKSVIDESID